MSTSWKTTDSNNFEIINRQGLVAKLFGGAMLIIAGCFVYWFGTAVVEYARFGTWKDVLAALPGLAITLFMIALFGIPGMLMAFLKKKTICDKSKGQIRHITFFGLFRRVREINLSDVAFVASKYKTTKGGKFGGGGVPVTFGGGGVSVPTVELVLAGKDRLEVAQLEKWNQTLKLGIELAEYLGVTHQGGQV